MKIEDHFLPEDIKRASEEYWCVMDLLSDVMDNVFAGDIEMAKHRSIDLLKSIHELSKMSDKKTATDRRLEMVNELNAAGVNIELVRRHLSEKQNS
ncbi:hypothetical protein [Virgibacillus sediminis]|uniref:Uncharacterized protein n=1 Tax=Virgibacillus sediminis TaxID=202260 RepID=A0ABV7A6P5_9BACI